jgi:peroxiredoxin
LPFTVALDPQGEIAMAFDDVKLTPTAFLIDRQGKIVRKVVGELDFAALYQFLDETLGRAG